MARSILTKLVLVKLAILSHLLLFKWNELHRRRRVWFYMFRAYMQTAVVQWTSTTEELAISKRSRLARACLKLESYACLSLTITWKSFA